MRLSIVEACGTDIKKKRGLMNNPREEEIAMEIETRFANGFITSKQARAEIVEIIRKALSERDAEIEKLKLQVANKFNEIFNDHDDEVKRLGLVITDYQAVSKALQSEIDDLKTILSKMPLRLKIAEDPYKAYHNILKLVEFKAKKQMQSKLDKAVKCIKRLQEDEIVEQMDIIDETLKEIEGADVS